MRSMTAYGRGSASSGLGTITVEISSLNRNFLDLNIVLPSELGSFESDLRSQISKKISRGSVKCTLQAHYSGKPPIKVVANIPMANQIKYACDQIAQSISLEDSAPLVREILAKREDIIEFSEAEEEVEQFRPLVVEALEKALDHLQEMKEQEGSYIQKDLSSRLQVVQKEIDAISSQSGGASEKMRLKLQERINELLPGSIENEERLLREVAIYAQKIDITEEVTRTHSHIQQILDLFNAEEKSLGKRVEFLLQELLRESNTIASKADSAAIAHSVVTIKSELERMKEQVRNVE